VLNKGRVSLTDFELGPYTQISHPQEGPIFALFKGPPLDAYMMHDQSVAQKKRRWGWVGSSELPPYCLYIARTYDKNTWLDGDRMVETGLKKYCQHLWNYRMDCRLAKRVGFTFVYLQLILFYYRMAWIMWLVWWVPYR